MPAWGSGACTVNLLALTDSVWPAGKCLASLCLTVFIYKIKSSYQGCYKGWLLDTKKRYKETGGMARGLRALAPLPEDLGAVPGSNMAAPVPGDPRTSLTSADIRHTYKQAKRSYA